MAEKKNTAASIHQRLLEKARQSSRPFNDILQHFAIERFIYRLSRTPNADRFILKGALMFSVWGGQLTRPTMDIDLLGRIENSLEMIIAAMREACGVNVEPDGLSFQPETITASRITEDAEYEGIRVRVRGNLGTARFSLQIDIGFGDVIIPGPIKVEYPSLLNFPSAELKGYSIETTIAEKFQAMVKLGILNSRMKDFYDIWFLSRKFDFNASTLSEAIQKTFKNRNTPVPISPRVFDSFFKDDTNKQVQWRAFLKKAKLTEAPELFEKTIEEIRTFLEPVITHLVKKRELLKTWKAPGPWINL
jgi:hypothetical protein